MLAVDVAADDPALPYALGSSAELAAVASRSGAEVFVADVRDPAALAAAVAEAERRWGGLDVAIAAAGVIAGGVPQWEVPPGRRRRCSTWTCAEC